MIKTLLTATSALAMPTTVVAPTTPVNEPKLFNAIDSQYLDGAKTGAQKLVDLSITNGYTTFGRQSGFIQNSDHAFSDLGNNIYHEVLTVGKDAFRKSYIEVNSSSTYRDNLIKQVDNPVLSLTDLQLENRVHNIYLENGEVNPTLVHYTNIVLEIKTNDGSGDQKFYLKDVSNGEREEGTTIFGLGAQDNAKDIYKGVAQNLNYNMAPQVRLDNFEKNFQEMDIAVDFYYTGQDGKTPMRADTSGPISPIDIWTSGSILWGTNYAPQTYKFNYPITIPGGESASFNGYKLTTYQKLKTFGYTINYTDPQTNVSGSEIMYFANPNAGDFAMSSNGGHFAMGYSDDKNTLTIQNVTGNDLIITSIATTAHGY